MTLTTHEVALLEFEETHPRNTGLKQDAIRHQLNMTAVAYYATLNRIIARQDVIEEYPQLAHRLGRRAARRGQQRRALLGLMRQ